MNLPAREKFVALMREAVVGGTLAKLTLGKPAGADKTLKNLFVRPVALKSGPRLAFVWRHKTRDITKNFAAEEALTLLESMIGTEFLDAHLFTATINVQLEMGGGAPRIRSKETAPRSTAAAGNDRTKTRVISEGVPWLRALGVTDESGRPLAPMTDKFRQIEKFAEILGHLVKDSPWKRVQSGCSTWAAARATSPSPRASFLETGAPFAGLRRGQTWWSFAQGSRRARAYRAGFHFERDPSPPRRSARRMCSSRSMPATRRPMTRSPKA